MRKKFADWSSSCQSCQTIDNRLTSFLSIYMYSITFYLQAHRVYCFLVFSSTHTYTIHTVCTGKSMSEASTNPQYDDRLFIEILVQYMKIPSSNLGRTCYVQNFFLTFRTIFVHNMFSPCSAKRRASDKDLPAQFNLPEACPFFICPNG